MGLIASIASLVVLPIVVILFEKNSLTGFIVTAGLVLIQGLVNALCTSGFFGLTSFFSKRNDYISLNRTRNIWNIT
jgi:hypothetical protein